MRFPQSAPAAALIVLLACSGGPRPPQKVTILTAADVLSLDPNREYEVVTDSVLANVYDPLVALDENLELRTRLAESWEHPAATRWRFRLRRGVRFQDGTPLTATAVRDALTEVREHPELDASQFLQQVVRIEVVDAHTIDLVTREPRALLSSLAMVYVTRPNTRGPFPPLVGTGPFRVAEWKAGERLRLERFDGYRDAAPALREAVFLPVPDPRERVRRLREGHADLAYDIPPGLAADPPPPGVRFERRTSLVVYYLGLDVRDRPGNPFHEPRVRRALHLALDRERLVSEVLHGIGRVATQPVSPLVFGFDPEIPPPVHDPERARRLLVEAGWPEGFRVRLDVPTQRLAVAQRIRQDLAEVGVTVEVNDVSAERLYTLAKSRRTRFFLAGFDCSSGEASEFYAFCLRTPGEAGGLGNYGGYSNPRIDEIADSNAAVLDPVKRRNLLQEADRIVMRDLPVLPLYVPDNIYGRRTGVRATLRADGEVRLLGLSFQQ